MTKKKKTLLAFLAILSIILALIGSTGEDYVNLFNAFCAGGCVVFLIHEL